MTERPAHPAANMLSPEETDEMWLQRRGLLTPELYPALENLSAGFAYRRTLRAVALELPEYVTVTDNSTEGQVAVARWNLLWEAAQFRRRMFDKDDLPEWMAEIADQGDKNIIFVPRTHTRYTEFAPLYHLLPKATLEAYGLPVLARGLWPELIPQPRVLPDDMEARLSKAWAGLIWKELMPASRMRGFTRNDPIHLLSHNLEYWLPPVTQVIHERLNELPQGPIGKDPIEEPAILEDGSTFPEATITRPRLGSSVWMGEADAAEARKQVVEAADNTGNLRAILDAVKSNRIEDDFSSQWTYAREDFERKLHHKRAKAKVTFVELPDGPAIQGPDTEVVGNMVCNDFLALLDPKDRRIVVLLASGHSKLSEVAQIMGYANHSGISKRLSRIRLCAEEMLTD